LVGLFKVWSARQLRSLLPSEDDDKEAGIRLMRRFDRSGRHAAECLLFKMADSLPAGRNLQRYTGMNLSHEELPEEYRMTFGRVFLRTRYIGLLIFNYDDQTISPTF
jgi:hypothetical protein